MLPDASCKCERERCYKKNAPSSSKIAKSNTRLASRLVSATRTNCNNLCDEPGVSLVTVRHERGDKLTSFAAAEGPCLPTLPPVAPIRSGRKDQPTHLLRVGFWSTRTVRVHFLPKLSFVSVRGGAVRWLPGAGRCVQWWCAHSDCTHGGWMHSWVGGDGSHQSQRSSACAHHHSHDPHHLSSLRLPLARTRREWYVSCAGT